MKTACFVLLVAAATLSAPARGAENLRMRDGISFFHDLDRGFPIIADKLDDVEIAHDRPTLVFFAAPGDLNTNRQAKRIVDVYKKFKDERLKFVVVNVDHPPNSQAKALIKSYYPGYIPTELIFDKQGNQKWHHTGEVDAAAIAAQLNKVL